MTPDVSRAVATVRAVMELGPGEVLDELLAAGEAAQSVADLPQWARNVLSVRRPQP